MDEAKTISKSPFYDQLESLQYEIEKLEKATYMLNERLSQVIKPSELPPSTVQATMEQPVLQAPLTARLEDLKFGVQRANENLLRIEQNLEL